MHRRGRDLYELVRFCADVCRASEWRLKRSERRVDLVQRLAVPEYLISEPSGVVARMIKGIRRNRPHVFPDKHARRIHYIVRFAPWLVPLLDRRMQAQAIEAGETAGPPGR